MGHDYLIEFRAYIDDYNNVRWNAYAYGSGDYPTGRNFVADYEALGENSMENAANLIARKIKLSHMTKINVGS